MKQDWFARLYESEIKSLKGKVSDLMSSMEDSKSNLDDCRIRDLKIYKACLHTAFHNDLLCNRDSKITDDELSMLCTLSKELGISQEEVKLINYSILPLVKIDVDQVIAYLRSIGVVFYSKSKSTIYVADEMIRMLRKIRGKVVADKFFRRVLRSLKEPQINNVCKKYDISTKKLTIDSKIKK